MKRHFILWGMLLPLSLAVNAQTFTINGKVIDRNTRQGVPYASVSVEGKDGPHTMTDSIGKFLLTEAPPGIHRLAVSSIGYKDKLTSEYQISARTPFIEVELEEDPHLLGEVSVSPSPLRRTTESPVSLYVIGLQDIEKIPYAENQASWIDYETDLGIWSWGGFVSADYASPDGRFTSSLGIRADASNYVKMRNVFNQISPRISVQYTLDEHWSLAGNAGIYYELPPYTALGFKDNEGKWVNRELKYQRVASGSVGVS